MSCIYPGKSDSPQKTDQLCADEYDFVAASVSLEAQDRLKFCSSVPVDSKINISCQTGAECPAFLTSLPIDIFTKLKLP